MTDIIKRLFILFCCTWSSQVVNAQDQKKEMLIQIAKLQVYIGYLIKGYNIVQDGLNLVSDIKNGDFHLHQFFFDRLKQVNPKVKLYGKVADMISMQIRMLTAYKNNYKQFKQSGSFTPEEIDYLFQTLSNLLDLALSDINDLTTVLTNGELEMSDNERINRIDKLWNNISLKYQHLFSFLDEMKLLSQQRTHELRDIQTLKNMYAP
ncbi:hypothetical protein A3860_17615 [Niastella vici]|uniref:TerB family tellurite resistance protein n=1 Tax=Niastella vici TaxID=1703345 RepID=A0A1V9G4J9_9BACT|nr:hypothetical protein [Niastella vici]OQP65482.1 hypothetical protein A3860_17615 [Niastella vici]